jgi:hypothetical protein
MRICAEWLRPRRRFDMPPIAGVADVPAALAAICGGIARGELTALEADRLTRMVERMARTLRSLDPAPRRARAAQPDLRADESAAGLTPAREPASAAEPPRAGATNPQAEGPTAGPEPAAKPAAPAEAALASATNLQAEGTGSRPGPSAWLRDFMGELYEEPDIRRPNGRPIPESTTIYNERTMDQCDGPAPPPQGTRTSGSNRGISPSP